VVLLVGLIGGRGVQNPRRKADAHEGRLGVDSTRTFGRRFREAKVLRNAFFRWCTLSLKGHLIFFQLLGATPLSLWAILTMQSEGTLTLARGIRITLLCSVLVAIGAALLWYAFSKPLIKSRGEK